MTADTDREQGALSPSQTRNHFVVQKENDTSTSSISVDEMHCDIYDNDLFNGFEKGKMSKEFAVNCVPPLVVI